MLLYPTYQSRLFLNVGPTRKHFFSSSKRRFPPLLLTRARASSMFCSLRSMLPKPCRSHNLFFDFYGKGKHAPCKPLLPQVSSALLVWLFLQQTFSLFSSCPNLQLFPKGAQAKTQGLIQHFFIANNGCFTRQSLAELRIWLR